MGVLASTSIVFSAAYTMYMFNRTIFGGNYSKLFVHNIIDVNKREFNILIILILLTVSLGIYPSLLTDALNYNVSDLIYKI